VETLSDKINAMDRNVFWALIAYTFAILFLYLLFLLLAPFGTSLIWAAVVGIATFPLYERLRDRFRGRDGAASAVMTLIVLLVFVLPTVGLVVLLAGEASDTYRILESAAQSGKVPGFDAIRVHPSVAPWVGRGESLLRTFGVDIGADLLPAAKRAVSSLLGFASGLLKNVFISLFNLLLMLVILFFIYRDGRRLEEEFWSVIPLPDEDKKTLKENLSRVLTAGVIGILGTCIVQGILGGIGFWIGGLPSPVLFGSLMAIAALVPFVGTALFWVPGGIYLLLAGKTAKGIFLLVWGVLVVGSADNVIRPLLIGGKADLPVSLMALGAIGGFAAFGLMGVVIGPVLLSLSLVLFAMYKARAFRAAEPAPTAEDPGGDGKGPV
jgi:predicted PurR-regulated permease PerM